MFERTRQWIEVRLGIKEIIDSGLREFYLPRGAGFSSTLGAVALVAFLIQAISGIFLLMYYIPDTAHAFMSVRIIMNKVPYGWLFRSIHMMGSNIILAVLFLHLVVTFYRISYKKPRELTWISGAIMFFLIILFCISGSLLSWNQLSYWSTTIVTYIPTLIPGIGGRIAEFIRGGQYVSGSTLNRFFAFHVAFLPFTLVCMAAFHLFFIGRTGFSTNPGSSPEGDSEPQSVYKREINANGMPFYPDYLLKALVLVMVYLASIFFIMTFFPGLFQPELATVQADPAMTPDVIRPPWYFLAPYQIVKLIPNKFLGISAILILVFIFVFWPFIDGVNERNISKRPLLRVIFILSITVWLILTVWGGY
ncbi:cytochrome b/c1 [bacterium BMS3Abin07]|nr:cytochrome b/c1 [bacterium BMS3Abin07]GBE33446.1 cytochrome b/c1 [bacterium BMS3Bbin05]HDO22325.1 cytochrome bc complex cytochrome b subunit [Nitrospirota bacterium]HDZ88062.1 cytochrome bc complex cytochrome b subunit [Nitrospirota bacterium]